MVAIVPNATQCGIPQRPAPVRAMQGNSEPRLSTGILHAFVRGFIAGCVLKCICIRMF